MMEASSVVRRADAGGVVTLTIDHPPVNVLTTAAMVELAEAVDRAGHDPAVKVVQVRGKGRAFCAGVDISDHTADKVGPMMDAFMGLIRAIDRCEVPTVAAVHGACLGGGLEVAGCCDLFYAAEGAKLGQPEIKVGVLPPAAIAAFPSRIGGRATAEIVLLGENFAAARGKEVGLVNEVFPDGQLFARVDAVCASLAALSRPVLALAKRALKEAAPPVDPVAFRSIERLYLGELMALDDAREGLAAFLEKREPVFKDR
jgi:cyclohexa-1,5-dienecarbonyl-CoA hydratase